MASGTTLREALESLRGLAEVNRHVLASDPELLDELEHAFRAGRFAWIRNRFACGTRECWTSARELLSRYPEPAIIPADCKQLSAALAALLACTCPYPVWVGIRPPDISVAHAVAGVEDQGNGSIRLLDPSVVAGMPPLRKYDGVGWMQVRGRRC